MREWEKFENDISKYINDALKDYDVIVRQYGNADSTIPDIEIKLNKNNKSFFIETKMPSSQTSQFVVEIKDNMFVYGKKNKFDSNHFSQEIIDVLNNNFDFYKNIAQSGMIVPVPDTIAFGWIASNMRNKNVEFITSVDSSGNKKIIPLDDFNKFFNIKTIFRRKKSGSQGIPKRYYNDFKEKLENRFGKFECVIKSNKLFVKIEKDLSKSECYIESDLLLDGKKYFLSKKENYLYEVKLTSGTNNPNIIFELSLDSNNNEDMFTIQCLIDYILNEEKDD